MARRKNTPTAQIGVADQVGKRHVVVRYHAPDESRPDEDAGVHVEYRLSCGRMVVKTGTDTYQTTDGRLFLKAL